GRRVGAAGRPHGAVHPPAVALAGRGRADDQLPFAALVAARAGGRVRRPPLARPVRRGAGRGLPVPVLRRRHVARARRGGRRGRHPVSLSFAVGATCGAARTGTVTTARGSFSTPCFMPVGTRGAVRTLSAADLEDLGVEVVLGKDRKSTRLNSSHVKT